MDIPSTAIQLVAALLLVLPGAAYQVARSRLRGPNPDDASATNRILRALGFSAGLDAIYAVFFGPRLVALVEDPNGHLSLQVAADNARSIGLLVLALLLVVPALFAGAGTALTYFLPRIRGRFLWIPRLSYDPTPRAWDYTFREIQPCFVRLLMNDNSWLGGWYGPDSFVSSYPEPREMFVEKTWQMSATGEFLALQPQTAGMFVRCDDIRTVELVTAQP